MNGNVYGYARVSTKDQHIDRQVVALLQAGVEEKNIFVEYQSGKDFNRPVYQDLLQRLQQGDTLVITSVDRLGRDYDDTLEQWGILIREKGISLVVLELPLLNTDAQVDLIQRLIANLILEIQSYTAQVERENIRRRQRQGIDAAKARGVRFGRPRVEMPKNFPEVVESWRKREINSHTAAGLLGVSRNTFFRRVRELEKKEQEEQHSFRSRA